MQSKFIIIFSRLCLLDNTFNSSDFNEFLDDLEEDPALRQNINIFRDASKQIPVDSNDVQDETAPHITLEEMLDDLVIDDVEMGDVE